MTYNMDKLCEAVAARGPVCVGFQAVAGRNRSISTVRLSRLPAASV
jgi:hypothetical protein